MQATYGNIDPGLKPGSLQRHKMKKNRTAPGTLRPERSRQAGLADGIDYDKPSYVSPAGSPRHHEAGVAFLSFHVV